MRTMYPPHALRVHVARRVTPGERYRIVPPFGRVDTRQRPSAAAGRAVARPRSDEVVMRTCPVFVAQFDASVALPTDVVAATITSGTVLLELDNGLGFDPLRPSQSGLRGRIISTLSSGGVVLAADTVSGDAVAMMPGTTLARVIR